MHHLAQHVCRYVREHRLLRAGERVGAAVSGGADSVGLLRLLLELRQELGLVPAVVHLNHQIRGAEADADQQFVADLARQYGLLLHALAVNTPAYAAAHRLSLEAAARELRYSYFQQLLTRGTLDKLATAHTLDDQAETVLLRLTRGTGTTGLAGIYPQWPVGHGQWADRVGSSPSLVRLGAPSASSEQAPARPGEPSSPGASAAIIRPLLAVRRSEIQVYLRELGQVWREDASNLDPQYARNRVRHRVLPLLERELNPRTRELLAATAEIARAEEDYWAAEVNRAMPQVWTVPGKGGPASFNLTGLRRCALALQRRLVRAAAESMGMGLEFQHVEEVLALAQAPPAGEKQLMLPGGWRALRHRDSLRFDPPQGFAGPIKRDFEYSLPLPGEVAVPETGTVFRATLAPVSPERAAEAYDPGSLPRLLQVRNWRPGDRFWPQHTRAPRKVKELLQERKIPLAQRRAWPVITGGAAGQEQIIWLRGFPPPQALLASPGAGPGLLIQEYALQEPSNRAE